MGGPGSGGGVTVLVADVPTSLISSSGVGVSVVVVVSDVVSVIAFFMSFFSLFLSFQMM